MKDLEIALQLIAKRDGEGAGGSLAPRPQEYALTIAAHYDEEFIPALVTLLTRSLRNP